MPHSAEPVVGASPAVVAGLDHWRTLPVVQQPVWPDATRAAAAAAEVAAMPPLVFAGEIDQLRAKLAAAAAGNAFVLQGGDCAETFVGATAEQIRNRIKTLLQMAVVLTYGASMPVVKMGRMAGQFAKPRSSDSENRGGETLPAYRGDMVNGYDFTPESRTPDPARLVRGYHTAASTLNLVRAFTQGGFADLREVHSWNRGFAANPANQRYEGLARDIDRAIKFMQAAGADFEELKRVDLYTAHEGLLLEYERAMTRIDSRNGTPVDTSAHFVWIGERTRDLGGAHIDFFSRIRNPIGVKLGPTTTPDDLERLVDVLDPHREPGRLTFITRMGAGRIRDALPPLLEAVRGFESTPLWITDPMHGNGLTTPTGYKTRRFDDVVDEVLGFFAAHRQAGTFPGGIHIELTGDDVTECLGGSEHIDEQSLATRYESLCDPRLNHMQSLELAFLVAEELGEHQGSAEELGEHQGGAEELGEHQGSAEELGEHQGGAEELGEHQGVAGRLGEHQGGAGRLGEDQVGAERLGEHAAGAGSAGPASQGSADVAFDRGAHAVAGRHRAPAEGGAVRF